MVRMKKQHPCSAVCEILSVKRRKGFHMGEELGGKSVTASHTNTFQGHLQVWIPTVGNTSERENNSLWLAALKCSRVEGVHHC